MGSRRVNAVDGVLLDYLGDLLGGMESGQDDMDIPDPVVVRSPLPSDVDRQPQATVVSRSGSTTVAPASVMVRPALDLARLILPVIPDDPEPVAGPQTESIPQAFASPPPAAMTVASVKSSEVSDLVAVDADSALPAGVASPVPPQTPAIAVETRTDGQSAGKLSHGIELAPLDWQSSAGIDCLLFSVCGLKLAIPLPWLGGVHQVTDKVTPLFGQAAWSLGVWQSDKGKLTIIDSAVLIMPERKRSLAAEGFEYFIQLDRSPWALACNGICNTVRLRDSSVKWRGDTSKRQWLAGTVIAEMCALIDVPGLLELLEQQRRGHFKASLQACQGR